MGFWFCFVGFFFFLSKIEREKERNTDGNGERKKRAATGEEGAVGIPRRKLTGGNRGKSAQKETEKWDLGSGNKSRTAERPIQNGGKAERREERRRTEDGTTERERSAKGKKRKKRMRAGKGTNENGKETSGREREITPNKNGRTERERKKGKRKEKQKKKTETRKEKEGTKERREREGRSGRGERGGGAAGGAAGRRRRAVPRAEPAAARGALPGAVSAAPARRHRGAPRPSRPGTYSWRAPPWRSGAAAAGGCPPCGRPRAHRRRCAMRDAAPPLHHYPRRAGRGPRPPPRARPAGQRRDVSAHRPRGREVGGGQWGRR